MNIDINDHEMDVIAYLVERGIGFTVHPNGWTDNYDWSQPNYDGYREAIDRAEAKRERWNVMADEWGANIAVSCPGCGAVPAEPCHTASGKEYNHPYVHSMRRRAATMYHPAVRAIAIPLDEM